MIQSDQFARFRQEYTGASLTVQSVDIDPFSQFTHWMNDAVQAGITEPNAMTCATTSIHGVPSARIVLLKSYDTGGFTFFTNYVSRKGTELAENPHAALLFFWQELSRQVRISGNIEKVSAQESDAYFNSRPLRARIASSLSPQSQIIDSIELLAKQLDSLVRSNERSPVRPDHWGGYRVIPVEFEFWQGKPDRLHHRVSYIRNGDVWNINQLAP